MRRVPLFLLPLHAFGAFLLVGVGSLYPFAHSHGEDLDDLQITMVGISAHRAGRHLGCEWEVEVQAPWVESARVRTPSNEWFVLEQEDEEQGLWSFYHHLATLEDLASRFPPGDYLFEIGRNGGTTTTVIQVPETLTMPSSPPELLAPFYGQSDVPSTNALVAWTIPASNDYMAIALELDDRLDPSYDQFLFLPPSQTNYAFTTLSSNHIFEGGIYFGNVAQGTNADQASFFVARAQGTRLLFSTHETREPLLPLQHAAFRAGAMNETQCLFEVELNFDRPIQPLDEEPLYQTIRIETPEGDEGWIYAAWWQAEYGNRVLAQGGGTNFSDLPFFDGLYVISFQVSSNEAICSPFLLLNPLGGTPLPMPEQSPEILTPAFGSLTTKTVSVSWNPVWDPTVTGIYARLGGYTSMLPTNVASWGPMPLPPGMHGVAVAFWNGLLNLSNPDDIPYEAIKWRGSEHFFEVGHLLQYEAGTGGAIFGNATQLLRHGESGSPVIAYATDPGAVFSTWSDGYNIPSRTETNVTTDLFLRASFLSAGGAELDWYAARGIFPAPGETWLDVDNRPVPSKGTTLREENIADTDPSDPSDSFRISRIDPGPPPTITLRRASTNRLYRLLGCDSLNTGPWFPIPGAGPRRGLGGEETFHDFGVAVSQRCYRIEVSLP